VALTLIRNARAPTCLLFDDPSDPPLQGTAGGVDGADFTRVDLLVEDETSIGFVSNPEQLHLLTDGRKPDTVIDLDQGIILPCFVECHTHLDKGHIWPRSPNPDGTFMRALGAAEQDRERSWTATDLERRMTFALETAYAHGVQAIRTHLDSMGSQTAISWPLFAALRAKWQDRIALQAVPLFGLDLIFDAAHMAEIVTAIKTHGSNLIGVFTYPMDRVSERLDRLFAIAAEHGFDLDFHVDESSDPSNLILDEIAKAAIRARFLGKILCGHCCTLALQQPDKQRNVIQRVKEAGIAIVSLPMCNLYLQDRRTARTPAWRGLTAVKELKAAGVPVFFSSDNTRDPFYAYGDLDTLEVFREATRIGHLDHPMGDWLKSITSGPAQHMGFPVGTARITSGLLADFILFKARNWTELLSRPQSDRRVMRKGKIIEASLPDYRQLDSLAGIAP
jgi:cytosine/creatinine deaminase